ncbi:hypothetical protein Tco_1052894, partial [Tanacetum coccineum]
ICSQLHESAGGLPKTKLVSHSCSLAGSTSVMEVSIPIAFALPGREEFAPKLHESAGGLPKTKLVSHSCSLARSTSAMEVSIPIAFVLPDREHELNESFKLGRPPALS